MPLHCNNHWGLFAIRNFMSSFQSFLKTKNTRSIKLKIIYLDSMLEFEDYDLLLALVDVLNVIFIQLLKTRHNMNIQLNQSLVTIKNIDFEQLEVP